MTRLEREAKARVFLEETDMITTWLASSVKFLREQRELAKKIAAGKRRADPVDPVESGRSAETVDRGIERRNESEFRSRRGGAGVETNQLSADIPRNLVDKAVKDAKDVGFLKGKTDISKLIETP